MRTNSISLLVTIRKLMRFLSFNKISQNLVLKKKEGIETYCKEKYRQRKKKTMDLGQLRQCPLPSATLILQQSRWDPSILSISLWGKVSLLLISLRTRSLSNNPDLTMASKSLKTLIKLISQCRETRTETMSSNLYMKDTGIIGRWLPSIALLSRLSKSNSGSPSSLKSRTHQQLSTLVTEMTRKYWDYRRYTLMTGRK